MKKAIATEILVKIILLIVIFATIGIALRFLLKHFGVI